MDERDQALVILGAIAGAGFVAFGLGYYMRAKRARAAELRARRAAFEMELHYLEHLEQLRASNLKAAA